MLQLPANIIQHYADWFLPFLQYADWINQSGYEPLNLENGSFLNSDNFDATDF